MGDVSPDRLVGHADGPADLPEVRRIAHALNNTREEVGGRGFAGLAVVKHVPEDHIEDVVDESGRNRRAATGGGNSDRKAAVQEVAIPQPREIREPWQQLVKGIMRNARMKISKGKPADMLWRTGQEEVHEGPEADRQHRPVDIRCAASTAGP